MHLPLHLLFCHVLLLPSALFSLTVPLSSLPHFLFHLSFLSPLFFPLLHFLHRSTISLYRSPLLTICQTSSSLFTLSSCRTRLHLSCGKESQRSVYLLFSVISLTQSESWGQHILPLSRRSWIYNPKLNFNITHTVSVNLICMYSFLFRLFCRSQKSINRLVDTNLQIFTKSSDIIDIM